MPPSERRFAVLPTALVFLVATPGIAIAAVAAVAVVHDFSVALHRLAAQRRPFVAALFTDA